MRGDCSLEGDTALRCLLFHPLLLFQNLLSDSDIRIYVPLIRLSQRLSSDSEAFDDEDAAPKCLAMTASTLLFNTRLLLLMHMVDISP